MAPAEIKGPSGNTIHHLRNGDKFKGTDSQGRPVEIEGSHNGCTATTKIGLFVREYHRGMNVGEALQLSDGLIVVSTHADD